LRWESATASGEPKFPSSEPQPHVQKEGIDAVLKWSEKRVATAQDDFKSSGFRRMPSPVSWNEEAVYMVMVDRFANGDLANDLINIPVYQVQDQPNIDQTTECCISAEAAYWNSSAAYPWNVSNQSDLTWGNDVPPYLRSLSFFQRCGSQTEYRPNGGKFEDMPHEYNSALATKYDAGLLWPEPFHAPADMPDFATMEPSFQTLYVNLLKYWIAYADIDGYRFDAVKYVSADYIAHIATKTRAFAATLGKKNFFLTGEILQSGNVPFLYTYLGRMPKGQDFSPTCSVHPGCAGLVGDCCPSPGGFLACCFANIDTEFPIPQRVSEAHQELLSLAEGLGSPGPGLPAIYPPDDYHFGRVFVQDQLNASDYWANKATMDRHWGLLGKQAVPEWTWLFTESQDIERVLQTKGMGGDLWRLKPALIWTYTWRGIPTVYYGLEQGLNGQCSTISDSIPHDSAKSLQADCDQGTKDGLKRQDLFTGAPWLLGSAVPSVQESARIGMEMPRAYPPHWCQETLLDRENEVYVLARALGRIRRSCPLLSNTEAYMAACDDGKQLGYWKFRSSGEKAGPVAMLVLLSAQKEPVTEWSVLPPAAPQDQTVLQVAKWVDLFDPSATAEWKSPTVGGSAKLVVKAQTGHANYAILVPAGDAQADEGSASWHVCKAGAPNLPPLPMAEECRSNIMWITIIGLAAYLIILLWVFASNARRTGVFLCVVREPTPVDVLEYPEPGVQIDEARHIFTAAIEHTIPERKVKVSAGGLGKVLDQMLREHPPAKLSLMHPKFADIEYGPLDDFTTLEISVDMQKQTVKVYTLQSAVGEIKRVWYLLQHPWFETLISKDQPYPYPNTKLSVLRFWSLWNQAAAQLMVKLKADLYHCMDYHAAMAPLYIAPEDQIPMIIVLHNADYDGAVETEFISDVFWKKVPALNRLSWVFNLEIPAIRKYCTFEGRFNMLWAGISCVEENQKGHGICTVSGKYAAELKRERTMFKTLPAVLPLDNAIDSAADTMPKGVEELKEMRAKSKKALQEFCGLTVDPKAKILIFIGRWVKQKGVDHIALLASRILDASPEVQFVLAGPPGDPYGNYAQELLRPLAADYVGRVFVVTRFFMIPQEARAGAHFCLMPSCSEPFGYVDVEFGLLGVPSLGCAIGGLGKIPGVYFRQQNSDSQEMLLAGFSAAVQYALGMDDDEYWKMCLACIPAQFPFSTWRANLQVIYRHAQLHFTRDGAEAGRPGGLTLKDESYAAMLEDATEESKGGYRRMRRETVAPPVAKSKKVQAQLRRMQVAEASEFLIQSVSEDRVKELMSYWMANEGRDTDAETLQRFISLGDQRMSERSFATRALMRATGCNSLFGGDSCLRIHAVIALGYIISPVMDARIEFVAANAKSLTNNYDIGIIASIAASIGNVVGAFIWLSLSRAVPANLLMATALFLNQLLFSLSTSLLGYDYAFVIVGYDFVCGILTASRWLFLIWNFSEDFHGGFQVGTRRVAMIESFRAALAGLLSVRIEHGPTGIASTLFSAVALLLIMLIMLAPQCYSSYVLPATNFWRELKDHKVYMLLVASMAVNGLAASVWRKSALWLSMNGWTSEQVGFISCGQAVIVVTGLIALFIALHRFSVWGPWIMRDFTCWLPPGSLILAVAFWEIGHLHYHSYLLVTAIVVAGVIDVARFAAMWTAILVTLANKWYALQGAFIGFAIVQAFEAISPFVAHFVAMPFGVSPIWSTLVDGHPETDLAQLQKGTMLSVLPIGICAYLIQLAARPYFLPEVLTYKGRGNLMPDGTVGWAGSETAFIKASALVATPPSTVASVPVIPDDEDDDDDLGDSTASSDSDSSEDARRS